MMRETFFQNFDRLADTVNAVAQMRTLVVRLATSGRIVDQDSSDQPASELLLDILDIRNGLVKNGLARNRANSSMILAGDTMDLPTSWQRCSIADVCDLQTGATPTTAESAYFDGDIPWLVSGDINKGEILDCDGRISELGLENSNCKIIPRDSVLIALNGQGKTRATVALLRIEAALNQSLVAMIPYSRDHLLPEYLFWNLRGRYHAIREITGQDQRRGLNMKLVGQLSLPLAPVAEQKRIVARVTQLMVLCDRLEAQMRQREILRGAIASASLARFATDPTVPNLNFLFHDSYTVSPGDLRKAILTLAVEGNLVPQDPNDEPIDDLAPHSHTNRLPAIEDRELPFAVPGSWRWSRLGSIADLINGDRSKNYPNKSEYVPSGLPFINTGHIEPDGTLSRETMHYLSRTKFDSLRSGKTQPGDLVYCLRGATLGKTAIVDFPEGAVASSLVIIRPSNRILGRYAYYFLTSPAGRELIRRFDNGSAQPNLSANSVKRYVVPLPPIAEQYRIVAKVDQLMTLVAELDFRLTASKVMSGKLIEALVEALVTEKD